MDSDVNEDISDYLRRPKVDSDLDDGVRSRTKLAPFSSQELFLFVENNGSLAGKAKNNFTMVFLI